MQQYSPGCPVCDGTQKLLAQCHIPGHADRPDAARDCSPGRPSELFDWENVVHPGAPTQCQVDELNRRIGADGMTIQVTAVRPT